jgi:UPF0176 protein
MDVCTFYRFVHLSDLEAIRTKLVALGESLGVRGTVLLGEEGVNSTLCGSRESLQRFLGGVREVPGLEDLPAKFSRAAAGNDVFHRLKVRIKPEIVTLGVPGLEPARRTGEHVDAVRWNALLDDPEVIVIDTRNRYECAIGTFPGAIQPDTDTFREFPRWVDTHLDPAKHRRVAMFCTGGIRCEKASAFMLEAGFETVYQLDGGVLRYLETVGASGNRWRGECFVFDQRVSVDESLGEGDFSQCFACRHPLSSTDRNHPDYEEGIRCPHCAGTVDARRAAAFAERRRQVVLASKRGRKHVGERQTPAQRSGKTAGKVRRSV